MVWGMRWPGVLVGDSVDESPHAKAVDRAIISASVVLRPRPNGDFGMHSRDAYPQFADVWVPPGYHIELLRISEYGFPITPGYLASLG